MHKKASKTNQVHSESGTGTTSATMITGPTTRAQIYISINKCALHHFLELVPACLARTVSTVFSFAEIDSSAEGSNVNSTPSLLFKNARPHSRSAEEEPAGSCVLSFSLRWILPPSRTPKLSSPTPATAARHNQAAPQGTILSGIFRSANLT
jgi:hypothetical protein